MTKNKIWLNSIPLYAAAAFAAIVALDAVAAYDVKPSGIRPAWSGAEPGVWTQDYAAATNAAAQAGKPVIVMITGMWWCPHCQALESKVLSQDAWAEFVGETGAYLVSLDFPYRGTVSAAEQYKTADFDERTQRPGWGLQCWLYNEEYRAENGLADVDVFKLIEERNYAWQNSLGLPTAQTVMIGNWDGTGTITYRRVGYPTLLVIGPDGRVMGRPTCNVTAASWTVESACAYVIGNVRAVLQSADEWDEMDDLGATATPLDEPGCAGEFVLQGEHALGSIDKADWFKITLPEAYGEVWTFSTSPREGYAVADLVISVCSDEDGKNILASSDAVASAGSVSVVFPAAGTYYVKIISKSPLSGTAGYVFRYRYEDVVVPASFATSSVSFANNAPAAILIVKLGNTSTNYVTEIDWRTLDGTASNRVDFVSAGGTLLWEVGEARSSKSITIPILAPQSETLRSKMFSVELLPRSHCTIPDPMATCVVTLSPSSVRNAGSVAFDGSWTTAKPIIHEGESFMARLVRVGGYEGEISARVSLVMKNGYSSYQPQTFTWEHNDRSDKTFEWNIPVEVGLQDDRSGYFSLDALDGAALGAPNKAQFVVRDSLADESFDEYNASVLGGIASVSGDAWFFGRESEGSAESVLRSRTLTSAGTALSLSLNGPVVLSLSVLPRGGATASLSLGDKELAADFSGSHLVAVPAGSQKITIAGKKGTEQDSYIVADWTVSPLAPVRLVAENPADGDWVRATDDIALSASLEDASALPEGTELKVVTYAGMSSSSLAKLPCESKASLAGNGFTYPPEGDAVAATALLDFATNAAGAYAWWRMDAAFIDEYGGKAVRQGRASVMKVLSADAPDVVSEDAPLELSVGANASSIAALPFVNVDKGDLASVSVKSGSLPEGVKATVGEGGVVFSGAPSGAGDAEAVLQVVVSRPSGDVVTGATFRAAFRTVALGVFAGEYSGYRVVRTADKTVRGAGFGAASLTLKPTGVVVGSFSMGSERYSFAAGSYSERGDGKIVLSGVTASSGVSEATVDVEIFENSEEHDAVIVAGDAEYWLYKNTWRTSGGRDLLREIAGSYTAVLPVIGCDPDGIGPQGTGYMHADVKANGTVSYFGVDSLGRHFTGLSPAYYVFDCCTGSGKRWFFYVNAVPLGCTGPASGISGLIAITPDEKNPSVRYLSTDESVPLCLVDLGGDSAYPFCWTNSLNVVGGTYDIPSGMDLSRARETFEANGWNGTVVSYSRNTGEFSVRLPDSGAMVRGMHVRHIPGGGERWSGLYVLPDGKTQGIDWENKE